MSSPPSSSTVTHQPLPTLDPSFTDCLDERWLRLEVKRVWAKQKNVNGASDVLRIEACDAGPSAMAGLKSTLVLGPSIELYLYGRWSNLAIVKGDVIELRHCQLLPSNDVGDSLEHPYKIVIKDAQSAEETEPSSSSSSSHHPVQLRLSGWKDRILRREGKCYNLESLKQEEEGEEEQIEGEGENQVEGEPKNQESTPGKKGKKSKTSNTTATSTATSSVAGSTASAPIDVDEQPFVTASKLVSTSNSSATKKRKRGSDIHGAYVYTPLNEMRRRPREKLNLYAVVLFTRGPKPTHGSDLMMSLTVVDMTLNESDVGMTFNVFRRSATNMPTEGTVKPGDIVRIHRAEVSDFQGTPIGVLQEKSSSFILIRGGSEEKIEPYFTPSDSW